ncbi:hypothetical protein [Streptomyces sp. UG1]|uniref:hypothetical protein n=1 Tax=Streptomyces sp. UG1 TaxID=3417652 RepID=UPI003CF779B9
MSSATGWLSSSGSSVSPTMIGSAVQVRRVVGDLIAGGQWRPGDADILVVFDVGYDAPCMALLLSSAV